jgi:hypothetical protein
LPEQMSSLAIPALDDVPIIDPVDGSDGRFFFALRILAARRLHGVASPALPLVHYAYQDRSTPPVCFREGSIRGSKKTGPGAYYVPCL